MWVIITAIFIFGTLFGLFSLSVHLGHRFGQWRMTHTPEKKLGIVTVAEGAVFALLGLLIAFTFSGAYERFEARKIHIIEEVNAIDTAYFRLGLLKKDNQKDLRSLFLQYIDSRIGLYKIMSDSERETVELKNTLALRTKIWDQALAACKIANQDAVTQLIIPAINTMFEVANLRFAITKIHPPAAIFLLLIGLTMLSSFLIGYTTAKTNIYQSLYTYSYIFIISFTIYIIIDLEFPRTGLIRVQGFDEILVDLKNHLMDYETHH